MKKKWQLATGLALALALAWLGGCATTATEEGVLPSGLKINFGNQQEGIWVSGRGEVTAVPDIVNLQLGISSQRASVAEAQSEAAAAMDRVMTSLSQNGVADKDIQTQQFSIQQITRWDEDRQEQVVIGYRVDNMVLAKIREIAKTGAIIDAVAVAGGDYTRINSISFSIDDPSNYKNEARDKAMADARAKAEQLANLSGVKLGLPTYITESVYYPMYTPVVRAEAPMPAPAAVTPISPGEMKVTIDVQVAYAIAE